MTHHFPELDMFFVVDGCPHGSQPTKSIPVCQAIYLKKIFKKG
jgi:hypothetical protein